MSQPHSPQDPPPSPSGLLCAKFQGHVEYFLCDIQDLEDPDGVPKQSCFNKHPLNRAPDDDFNSPVDPMYPGRYYIDPPCRYAIAAFTRR